MNYLKGKFCVLEPFKADYFNEIYYIDMDIERMIFFSENPKVMTKEKFADRLSKNFQNHYHQYFVVRANYGKKIIGYVYSYNFNAYNGHIYMAISSDETPLSRCAIAEAGIIFIDFIFRRYSVRKIYADIYNFNEKSIHIVTTTGFVKEAELREHRYYDGEYHSMLIYALYRESFYKKNTKLLNRISRYSN